MAVSGDQSVAPGTVTVGSIGYELHKDADRFAALVAGAGFKYLIDVRELPNSRRRGFAKTALSNALAEQSVEYRHLRSLGNPKELRDLYKSGRVAEGEAAYRELLLTERREALLELASLLREKRSALMCLEDDEQSCHRRIILEALESEVGMELEVVRL